MTKTKILLDKIMKKSTTIIITGKGNYCSCCNKEFEINEESVGIPNEDFLDINICKDCLEDIKAGK